MTHLRLHGRRVRIGYTEIFSCLGIPKTHILNKSGLCMRVRHSISLFPAFWPCTVRIAEWHSTTEFREYLKFLECFLFFLIPFSFSSLIPHFSDTVISTSFFEMWWLMFFMIRDSLSLIFPTIANMSSFGLTSSNKCT